MVRAAPRESESGWQGGLAICTSRTRQGSPADGEGRCQSDGWRCRRQELTVPPGGFLPRAKGRSLVQHPHLCVARRLALSGLLARGDAVRMRNGGHVTPSSRGSGVSWCVDTGQIQACSHSRFSCSFVGNCMKNRCTVSYFSFIRGYRRKMASETKNLYPNASWPQANGARVNVRGWQSADYRGLDGTKAASWNQSMGVTWLNTQRMSKGTNIVAAVAAMTILKTGHVFFGSSHRRRFSTFSSISAMEPNFSCTRTATCNAHTDHQARWRVLDPTRTAATVASGAVDATKRQSGAVSTPTDSHLSRLSPCPAARALRPPQSACATRVGTQRARGSCGRTARARVGMCTAEALGTGH